MSNELAVAYKANDGSDIQLDPQSIARYIVTGPSGAQASEKEVARFIATCQARRLNPLAGDCYLTVYNGQQGPQASIIVSKDYFQDQANQNPDYDGCECGVITVDSGRVVYHKGAFFAPGETLVGAWCDVKVKSRSLMEHVEVPLAEYNTGRSLWKTKPATMICKVARVQALRAAFPRSFAGVYDSSEIDTNPNPQPKPVQAVPAPVPPQPAQVQAAPAPARRKMTQEQAAELADLCSEASMACGQPVDVLKRHVWTNAGAYDGTDDWGDYMARARDVAVSFCEAHIADEPEYEGVPYES